MNSSSVILLSSHISFETHQPVLDIALLIYTIIIQMLMIFTNSILLHVIFWKPQLRENPTYLLICSLVMSDLLYAISFCVAMIMHVLPLDPTQIMCSSILLFLYFPTLSSGLNFIVCLGDRYMKICHPFRYANIMSRKSAIIVLTIPWVIAALTSVITFTEGLPGELFNGICPAFYIARGLAGEIVFICAVTIVLLMISGFMYGIYSVSIKQQNQVRSTSSATPTHTLHKRIAYLLSFSFVFYVPMMISVAIDTAASLYRTSASFRLWYQITVALSHLHFALHSVVYGWNDKKLKYHIKKLFTNTTRWDSEE